MRSDVVAFFLSVASVAVGLCQAQTVSRFKFNSLQPGQLKGKLTVQWLEPDLFLFTPDPEVPLTFVRYNGQKITPGRMITDGGSIPRPIWVLRNYSPWGFAPAYIVHDWIFEMHNCKMPGHESFTLDEAGRIMAEIMKTMIVQKKIDAGPLTVTSMYLAVTSPVARTYWQTGKCNPPPSGFGGKPLYQFELTFP